MPHADAILQDQRGQAVLRFERVLRHPPERVWRALTEPEEQSAWHPTPAEFEPTVGGAVRYSPEGDVPDFPEGEVIDWDPPRLLAYTWGEDQLRWEVREHQEGCVLTLLHSFDDRFKAARDAAGWHVCLDALSESLDGTPAGAARETREHGWRELNSAYEKRFGIPHDRATPPPEQKTSR